MGTKSGGVLSSLYIGFAIKKPITMNIIEATYTNIINGCYLTWDTTNLDPQITHVRIYRTVAGMGDFYYEGEEAISTGFYVLTKKDDELDSELSSNHLLQCKYSDSPAIN